MHHFIFTLGSEFEPIQNNYRIGCLPLEWQTTHWPSLLVLCRDFYNSANPKGLSSVGNRGITQLVMLIIFPYKLEDGSYITPFELVHGVTEICLWCSILVVKRNFCFSQPKSACLIIAFSVNLF